MKYFFRKACFPQVLIEWQKKFESIYFHRRFPNKTEKFKGLTKFSSLRHLLNVGNRHRHSLFLKNKKTLQRCEKRSYFT